MKDIINEVYKMLQEREVHPSGTFDKAKRFIAEHDDLVNVRTPSRRWPNSHMVACRTKKYVKAVCEKFNCNSKQDLLSKI